MRLALYGLLPIRSPAQHGAVRNFLTFRQGAKMSQSLQDLETQGNHYMSRRGLNMRALIRVAAYIEDNLGERFTLDSLANAPGMSGFHFARRFLLTTGCSPMTYVL